MGRLLKKNNDNADFDDFVDLKTLVGGKTKI